MLGRNVSNDVNIRQQQENTIGRKIIQSQASFKKSQPRFPAIVRVKETLYIQCVQRNYMFELNTKSLKQHIQGPVVRMSFSLNGGYPEHQASLCTH